LNDSLTKIIFHISAGGYIRIYKLLFFLKIISSLESSWVCYCLKAHVLKPKSSAGGAILGGSGNFRRRGLARDSRSLGAGPHRNLILAPSCLFLSFSCPPGGEQLF
jgi:hypothetical protein